MSGCARQRHPITFQSFQYTSPFSFLDFASFLFTFFSCTLGVRRVRPAAGRSSRRFRLAARRVAAISDVFPSAAVLRVVCIHGIFAPPREVAALRDAAGSQEVGHCCLRRWRASFPMSKINCMIICITGRLLFCGASCVPRSTVSFEMPKHFFCERLPAAPPEGSRQRWI